MYSAALSRPSVGESTAQLVPRKRVVEREEAPDGERGDRRGVARRDDDAAGKRIGRRDDEPAARQAGRTSPSARTLDAPLRTGVKNALVVTLRTPSAAPVAREKLRMRPLAARMNCAGPAAPLGSGGSEPSSPNDAPVKVCRNVAARCADRSVPGRAGFTAVRRADRSQRTPAGARCGGVEDRRLRQLSAALPAARAPGSLTGRSSRSRSARPRSHARLRRRDACAECRVGEPPSRTRMRDGDEREPQHTSAGTSRGHTGIDPDYGNAT